jgi:hypothetical protein
MIRRWSCINDVNSYCEELTIFEKRFNSIKLLKAVNYRKYRVTFSHFKRRKLSRWKRRQSWLLYTQIFRNWVKDYNLNKKLVKSQYFDSILPITTQVYDFKYIKKKNILDYLNRSLILCNSLPKFFLNYYNNRLFNKNTLISLNTLNNVNLLNIMYEEPQSLNIATQLHFIPILYNTENLYYLQSNSDNYNKIKSSIAKYCIILNKVSTQILIYIYQTFIFYHYYNFFKR